MTLLYGGTVANVPPKPICGVGLPVPVLLKATKVSNIQAQTPQTGSPALGVTVYQTNQAAHSGDLDYALVGGAKELGAFGIEVCGGGGCCDPNTYAFAVRNLSGGSFTLYEVAPLASFTFDWDAAPPPPLTCQASAAPTSGTAPLAVSFTASAQGGSPPFSWKWNFGDGATSTQKNPTHTYHGAGTYKWKMTLTDMAGATLQKGGQIQVSGALSVTASASPRSGDPPLAVVFTATPTGGTPPYSFDWDFGDGTLSLEQNPVHDFPQPGQYDCRVTVADAQARAAMATAPVYVGIPIPPQVSDVRILTSPFRLKVLGTDFQAGCSVTLGGVPAPLVQFKNGQKLVLKKGLALKNLVPKGTPVEIVVTNPDGGISDPFPFER